MKTILIPDTYNLPYENGAVDFIMSTYKWWNVNNGFKAIVPFDFDVKTFEGEKK